MISTTYRSPLGDLMIVADERGLVRLQFAGNPMRALDGQLDRSMRDPFAAWSPERPSAGVTRLTASDAVSGGLALQAAHPECGAAASVVERAWGWLNAYFAGQAPRWVPPLHVEGTDFQHAVWTELMRIPYGQTTTCAQLAERVGRWRGSKTTARAVGLAAAHNAVQLVVPCHRMVGAHGELKGYAGGVDRQGVLLAWERRLPLELRMR